ALPYLESGELDLMFGFAHMEADCIMTDFIQRPFSLKKLKRAFSDWQEKLAGKAWNALYLENHDHPRVISRYGSERWRTESGKMLAACYMLQQGTPFVYQGQEIGMTNLRLPRLDMYVDVMLKNNCRIASKVLPQQAVLTMAQKSCRDSARTPMQWTGGPWAGFSETRPWFYVNENYRDVNVAVEKRTRTPCSTSTAGSSPSARASPWSWTASTRNTSSRARTSTSTPARAATVGCSSSAPLRTRRRISPPRRALTSSPGGWCSRITR
ncbi:MAG: alpha-amylase family glycosyl hydrolase, partial [Oscillospiraceae bacterium]